MLKKFLSEMDDGLTVTTWWTHEEVGTNKQASSDLKSLIPEAEIFQNPKPEALIARILELSTSHGDLVLDSFAGSGTTGAVAHKMGRRWIIVELGEHAVTHIVPRLRKVIDGTDEGGITEAVGWEGGGGFRFYRLAPSLLERDRWGQWIVSKEYNPAMLAEAMCKHMAFTYAPSQNALEYWNHGHSSERDFIYVTTQALTHSMLAAISRDVGPDRRLLICCKAWSGKPEEFDNLTVRKIPRAVLANCEWGRDDYSLQVANLPAADPKGEGQEEAEPPKKRARRGRAPAAPDLLTPADESAETEA